jgi:hypothetical protein
VVQSAILSTTFTILQPIDGNFGTIWARFITFITFITIFIVVSIITGGGGTYGGGDAACGYRCGSGSGGHCG